MAMHGMGYEPISGNFGMKPKTYITVEEVRTLFDYRHGHLWWKEPKRGRSRTKPAGCVDTNGYIRIQTKGRLLMAHRLIWLYHYGHWPEGVIDHIDGNRQNNELSNLRDASYSQNICNAPSHADSRHGYKGITWDAKPRKWLARIAYKGNRKFLGSFDCPREAHRAYRNAAVKLHGEFANFESNK